MLHPALLYDIAKLHEVCRRNGVAELSVFGSATTPDFGPRSDVDVLVDFVSGVSPSLLDVARLARELDGVFGRNVDVVVGRDSIENPYRKRTIYPALVRIYAA